jgi:hypothetical protein
MGTQGFSGDLLFPKEELHQEISLLSGETFSISKRNQDIQRLTEKYQDLGYAFTNVVPRMAIQDDTRTVDIDYSFEKGELVYFGKITVVGNSKTHDKVIRRELRIQEGELYSGSRLRVSRELVERLGFFAPGEVLFNTSSPADSQLTATPRRPTEKAARPMPKFSAAARSIRPAGSGRPAVRAILASMSASKYWFSAPQAPAPKARHSIAVKPITG